MCTGGTWPCVVCLEAKSCVKEINANQYGSPEVNCSESGFLPSQIKANTATPEKNKTSDSHKSKNKQANKNRTTVISVRLWSCLRVSYILPLTSVWVVISLVREAQKQKMTQQALPSASSHKHLPSNVKMCFHNGNFIFFHWINTYSMRDAKQILKLQCFEGTQMSWFYHV